MKSELLSLQKEKEKLAQTLLEKESTIAKLEDQLKGWKAKYQIEKFDSVQHIERLKAKLTQLNTQLAEQPDKSDQMEQLQSKIRQLIEERDQLQTLLSRANAQIEDLKLQAGQTGPIRLSMDNQVISLDTIAANAKIELAAATQQKNIDLEIVNPEAAAMIKTDPGLLQSILYHLLDNAIKASDSGSAIQLIQKLSYETGMLVIQVTDYGKGLTPTEQSALFGPEPKEVPGIGSLASIREAVRAIRVMNGKVWLKSEKDTFTTFRAQVPVRIID
jgi:signal transduction histidine kinase